MGKLKKDKVVEAVRQDLLNRSQVGQKKYGVTLDRKDLNLRDWLQHAYEEHLDACNYLKRAIMEMDGNRAVNHVFRGNPFMDLVTQLSDEPQHKYHWFESGKKHGKAKK